MSAQQNSPPAIESVKDSAGHVHELVEPPIGEGGQGRVYCTKDPEVLIKFACRDGVIVEDEEAHRHYGHRFDRLLEMDLQGIQLAAPETVLAAPYCGYSMRLLRDMEAISTLIVPNGQDLAEGYISSGGLRRRLAVLTALARVLARLHALPAAYGDISPNNLFISTDQRRASAWLIDADNMHLICDEEPSAFTPGYVSPELATNGRSSTESDSFGFACLAFHILCQHEAFNRGEEHFESWSCSQTNSQDADAGEEWLVAGGPWVHDEVDPLKQVPGIPWNLTCSSSLRKNFSQTFGLGRLDRSKRLSMQRWVEVLQQASDALVTCTGCGWSYFMSQKCCPLPECQTPRPGYLLWEIRRWDPDLDAGPTDPGTGYRFTQEMTETLDSLREENGSTTSSPPTALGFIVTNADGHEESVLTTRHCFATRLAQTVHEEVGVAIHNGRVFLTRSNARDSRFHIARADGRTETLTAVCDLRVSEADRDRWYLHCGDMNKPHRILIPRWVAPAGGVAP